MRATILVGLFLLSACGAPPPIVWEVKSGGRASDPDAISNTQAALLLTGVAVALAGVFVALAESDDGAPTNVADTGEPPPWH